MTIFWHARRAHGGRPFLFLFHKNKLDALFLDPGQFLLQGVPVGDQHIE